MVNQEAGDGFYECMVTMTSKKSIPVDNVDGQVLWRKLKVGTR